MTVCVDSLLLTLVFTPAALPVALLLRDPKTGGADYASPASVAD